MNTVAVIGRMLLALVFVLGVMWLLARWARKPLGGKADRVMAVLARQQLSRTSSVTVLRVMDRALVLGVTEQGVQLITETELSAVEDALATEIVPARVLGRRARAESPTGAELAAGAELAELPAGAERAVAAGPRSRPAGRPSALDGSVLSPRTWRQLVDVARDITVRR